MDFDTPDFGERLARLLVFHLRRDLLKLSPFFLTLVTATFIAHATLQAQSKSGDKVQKSTTRTTDAKGPDTTNQELRKPASVAEAAQAIDLSTFPLLPNVLAIHARSVSRLKYVVRLKSIDVRGEYEFQRRHLLQRQWKELPEGDGQFTRSGFHLYVTVQEGDDPGTAVVELQNNGNVNVSKLPVPGGSKYIKTEYNVADFVATSDVKVTRGLVRELLIEQGWQPYGTRGDSMDMKQNAVLLTASVTSLRQPGQTRIAYWTTQMPAELSLPPNAESILYQSDDNRLELVASGSIDEVTSYYRTALGSSEWEAAMEKPNYDANSQQFLLRFRNPTKDVLRLGMSEKTKEKTRVTLQYQSVVEADEHDGKP